MTSLKTGYTVVEFQDPIVNGKKETDVISRSWVYWDPSSQSLWCWYPLLTTRKEVNDAVISHRTPQPENTRIWRTYQIRILGEDSYCKL